MIIYTESLKFNFPHMYTPNPSPFLEFIILIGIPPPLGFELA